MTDEHELSFEDAYHELEATVQHLEEGSLTLEQALALYERGVHLAQRCQATLDAADLKVREMAVGGTEPDDG